MSTKRRLKKMQRQRRVANHSPQSKPTTLGHHDFDDDDDHNLAIHCDPTTGIATAVSGLFGEAIPMSLLVGHLIRNDGLAAEQLPAGAITELLYEHASLTDAKKEAAKLGRGCEAWYRWPVGHGNYIDLQLYHTRGRLQLPESLQHHPEVVATMNKIIFDHYIQHPSIHRTLQQQGAEAAVDLVEAIPIQLFIEDDY